MKKIVYVVFGLLFRVFNLCPVNRKKITFIMSHDTNLTGNMGYVYNEILEQKLDYYIVFFSREEYDFKDNKNFYDLIKGIFSVFFIKNYHLATSKIIILDNVFLAFAYLKFKKKVKVVQLWHAAGVLKKFGIDACKDKKLKDMIRKANRQISNVIVNSSSFINIYANAFHISENKIIPLGIPRTDLFFNQLKMEEVRRCFFERYPFARNKKIILYAPTFRENELSYNVRENKTLNLDVKQLYNALYPEYIFAIRLHPRINRKIEIEYSDFALDVSKYDDINHLLIVSDLLITDYSSLIAEYSVLKRPIIFYPYDLKEYETQERGFYYSYSDFVPGPIVSNEDELIKIIKEEQFDLKRVEQYMRSCFDHTDGMSTKRFVDYFLK